MTDRDAPDGTEPGPPPVHRVRRAVRESSARLEHARVDHPVVDALLQVVARDTYVAGGLLASAVAFRLFLWIVPVALVFVSAFGFYAASDPTAAEEYARDFGVSAFIAGSVGRALQASGRGRWLALVIGLVALAWSSRSLAVSIRAVHALAWDIRPAPPIKWTARAVLSVVGLMAGMLLVLPILNWLRDRSAVFGIIGMLGSVLVFAAFWSVVSALLPRRQGVPIAALVPGGLLVGTVLELMHLVSLIYLPGRFDRASSAYGALGVAVVALAWLYFSGRAVVAGAVLNVTLWERHVARNGGRGARDEPSEDPEDGRTFDHD